MTEIRLAKNAGFCWGVKRAIDIALEASGNSSESIYTYGPLIHNPQLIDLLERRKIHTLKELNGLVNKDIIIRTHGVAPSTRKEIKDSGNKIIDATCPLVAKVQGMIKKFSGKGYTTIIVGDDGHAEIVGLKGFSKTPVHVISGAEEVEALPDYEKVFVAAQTTCGLKRYAETVSALEKKYANIEIGDTICEATYIRQDEIVKLAEESDLIIVVGGKNSANTLRLASISRELGVETLHIETEDELNMDDLSKYKVVGVTAGASTPKWLIERVVHKLELLVGKERYPMPKFAELMRLFIKSNIYIAFSAVALAYINLTLMGIKPTFLLLIIPFSAVLSTYLAHQLFNASDMMISSPKKYYYHQKFKKSFWAIAVASFLGGLIASNEIGVIPTFLYTALVILGATYGNSRFQWKRILEFPQNETFTLSRDMFAAVAWGIVTVVIPYISAPSESLPFIPALFTVVAIYTRSVLSDIKDMTADQVIGKEALPVQYGTKKASLLLCMILAVATAIFITYHSLYQSTIYLSLLISITVLFLFIITSRSKAWASSTLFELSIDGHFFLVALSIFFS